MKTIILAIVAITAISCSKVQDKGLQGKWKAVCQTLKFSIEFKDKDVIFYFEGQKHGPTYREVGMDFRRSLVTYEDHPKWFDINTQDVAADTVFDTKTFIYRIYGDTLEMRGFRGNDRFTEFDRNDTIYTGIFVRE